MKHTYSHGDTVADVPTDRLETVIRATNHAHTEARRIQQILNLLRDCHGRPALDFLCDWPTDQILTYLQSLPGIGPKTASFVCLFSLYRPVMTIDVHVHRVSRRPGWIEATVSPQKTHKVLQALIPGDLIFPLHIGCWEHGHTFCRPAPRCALCANYRFCISLAKTAPETPVQTLLP